MKLGIINRNTLIGKAHVVMYTFIEEMCKEQYQTNKKILFMENPDHFNEKSHQS
jgi:hypothetical protein